MNFPTRNLTFVLILTILMTLTACGGETSNNPPVNNENIGNIDRVDNQNTGDNQNAGDSPVDDDINPYLSIVGRRLNPDSEEYVWDEVYYTYDLITKELNEICVLPHFSGYTSGVVSLREHAVYFSMREYENTNDRICRYDILSGEIGYIENENLSYNDMVIIDPNTLLVIALTREHTVTPALFDLDSGQFTYMASPNGEPIDLHTSGGQLLNYNYLFDSFSWVYFKLMDRYSDGYTSHEEAIDYNFTLVSSAELKKVNALFTTRYMAERQVKFLTQISKDVTLVKLYDTIFDETISSFITQDIYYRLTLDGEKSTFVQIDNPFPSASEITQALTFDGGKTYYCIGYYSANDTQYSECLFIYDCETDEITPILSEYDGLLSVANFRSVGL